MNITNDLNRFVEAQNHVYQQALKELRQGRKKSHWMWFIFPQLKGLGLSAMAQQYGIKNGAEAEAYLKHPVLGNRLVEIFETLLQGKCRDAHHIFGSPDDMKLRSCATLFAQVPDSPAVFKQVINAFFGGEPDGRTLQLLRQNL